MGKNVRQTKKQLIDTYIELQKGKPIVLDEDDYRDWLGKTKFQYIANAEQKLDAVRELLAELSKADDIKSDKDDQEKLELAIKDIDESLIIYQHSGIYSNSTHDCGKGACTDLLGTQMNPRKLWTKDKGTL